MLRLQQSPLKIICLLILLSFYSLIKTSFTTLIPAEMVEIEDLLVRIQPNLTYFEGLHVLYGSLALLVLGLLVTPVTILLLLTPFLQRCCGWTLQESNYL